MTFKLTKNKLIFFEHILEAIEERATFCSDYIYQTKTPSVHNEHFDSLEVGGITTVKKWLRGEYYYTTFPTECLYNNEALIRYRLSKEEGEHQKVLQEQETQTQNELKMLRRLAEKYPQFFEGDKFKKDEKDEKEAKAS